MDFTQRTLESSLWMKLEFQISAWLKTTARQPVHGCKTALVFTNESLVGRSVLGPPMNLVGGVLGSTGWGGLLERVEVARWPLKKPGTMINAEPEEVLAAA